MLRAAFTPEMVRELSSPCTHDWTADAPGLGPICQDCGEECEPGAQHNQKRPPADGPCAEEAVRLATERASCTRCDAPAFWPDGLCDGHHHDAVAALSSGVAPCTESCDVAALDGGVRYCEDHHRERIVEKVPPVKDQAWFTTNVGTGTRIPRWHFEHEGRTYITYAATREDAHDVISIFLGRPSSIPLAEESGYYCHVTNTIVDAKDGPYTFLDCRKSGRDSG